MLVWVVKSPIEGYKIRQIFGQESICSKEIIIPCQARVPSADIAQSCQKVLKSYFQSQFSMSKNQHFGNFNFSSKNINKGDHFLTKTSIFEVLYFQK